MIKATKISILSVIMLIVSSQSFSQNKNTVSAAMEFKDFMEEMRDQEMEEAKKHIMQAKKYIDMAAKHKKTAKDPKTLKYKGQIYMSVAAMTQQIKDDESLNQYSPDTLLDKSMKAFKMAIKYDEKERYRKEIELFAQQGRATMMQQGIKLFKEKKYDKAYEYFSGSVRMLDLIGRIDTLAHYNAGISSDKIENYENAAKHYKVCALNSYRVPSSYTLWAGALSKQGKNELAVEAIKMGRKKFPKNKDLMIEQANIYLRNNNLEEAEKVLNETVKQDPDNPKLHYAVGTVYDNLSKYDRARESYLKAIELDSNNFNAIYSMGALKFNRGVEFNEKAGQASDMAAIDSLSKMSNKKFKEALPYLEKAHKLNPEDMSTLRSLKQVYPRLNMPEKYKAIKKEIENL